MNILLAVLGALSVMAALFAGLASPERSLAASVAWYHLRYATSPAEAAIGVASLAGVAFACIAGGFALALSAAGRRGLAWADRAALSAIPVPH